MKTSAFHLNFTDPTMRKKYIAVAAFVLLLGGCEFGDQLTAYTSGSPVQLISATGSLAEVRDNQEPLGELMQASLRSDALRLIVRTRFYRSGPLARPYLTVDENRNGVIHIDTKEKFQLFATKCEFLRQFEIEIASEQWNGLASIQVFNHDVEQAAGRIPVDQMAHLLRQSSEQLALRDLSGVGGGC